MALAPMMPRGLFGTSRPSWTTPGINPDAPQIFGGPSLPQNPTTAPIAAPSTAQPEEPKSWLEGGKMRTRDIIGLALAGIGDAFGMPGQQNMSNLIQQRMMMTAQQRAEEQRRKTSFDDFVQRKTWERDNLPSQSSPHYWETNDGSLGMVGPDGKPQILYKDPTPKTDWIQVKDPVTGAISIVAKPIGGALPTFTAEDWDKAGGGTGNGVGGFR